MKTNIKAQLKNKIKIKMFKMARDPFDISRWNRNFYLRINHEVKKGFRFKGFLRQVFWFFSFYEFAEYNRNLFILNELLTKHLYT